MLSSTRNLEHLVVPALTFPDGPQSMVQRWREVAAAVPNLIAVVEPRGAGENARPATTYTYAQVDRLSDLIALDLVAELGDSELPVAALLGHDSNAAVALMALLKTGRIRVVLDTHLPAERLATIVELAGAKLVLVDDRYDDLATGLELDTRLSLDSLLANALSSTATPEEIAARVAIELALGESRGGKDPFEIVFTSGSTGTPKGVLQRNNSFLNDYSSYRDIRNIRPGDPVAVVLPMSFVAGSGCLLTTFFNGSTACLIDPRDTGVPALVKFLQTEHIAGLDATPHLLRGIVAELAEGEILPDIRFVGTLGEAIHRRDLHSLLSHLGPDAVIVNEVGSSEINSLAYYAVHQGDDLPEGNLPAGTIFGRKTVRLVDENENDVPEGQTGEMIVVSEFLSGGYWKDDEQNALKFGIHDDGREFVRQGDLARIRPDGVLQLLGRANGGVKVRGYLVEPSEIEGALMSLDDIGEAVVTALVTEGKPTRLIAYVVPRAGVRAPSSAAIRRSLRAALPEYMVPSEIMQLTALPRTERGKVDRRALPAVPERVVDVYEMDQRELAMSTVWQQVLELPAVGPDDDFMALGGDSLATEELVQVVSEVFGVTLAANEILSYPTLREFTRRVTAGVSALPSHPDIVTLNATGSQTPLFCFTGGGSLALTFLPLSRHFPDTAVYALQAHGMASRGIPDWSIEAMAVRFIRLMRIARPHGPYRLVGHSFGGLVAMEVARQLTAAGEEVESVVILDTYLPRNIATDEFVQDPAPTGVTIARMNPLAVARSLKQRFVPDGLPRGENIGRQARAYLGGVLRYDGQVQYDSFLDRAALLGRKYVLRPYAGKTVVVMTDDNPNGLGSWSEVLTGEHSYVHMNTEHTQLLREPNVAELASHLRRELPLLSTIG